MKRTIKTFGPEVRETPELAASGVTARLERIPGDPESVFRLYLERPTCSVEICPSKGLSVRNTTLGGRQMFWDPPLANLPDPSSIDLTGAILIDGAPVPGLAWITCFAAHVEMLGLLNWGMNTKDADGKVLCLHGNASMIPVEEIELTLEDGRAVVTGSLFIRDANGVWPPAGTPPLFRIDKRIELMSGRDAILVTDTIENVSSAPLRPDWGYHVQLRPEEGCRYVIPSGVCRPRGGGDLPREHDTWRVARNHEVREERGYIHRKVERAGTFPDGSPAVESLLLYPDGRRTRCLFPPAPFVLSWFSCGGANGDEFLLPDGTKWMDRNWDGVGPEIGASALDHDGDTDPDVPSVVLLPGERLTLNILVEPAT